MNFKIGDHVVCEKSNVKDWNYCGKTGVVEKIDSFYEYPYRVKMDDGSADSWCTVKCLVEEKKMLTKNDLKTGMFGVLNTGDKFVIVNDKIVYQDGGYDNISSIITDNYFNYIQKLYEGVSSFRMLDRNLKGETVHGTLVYDRDKTLYNGKVVCVKNTAGNANLYTVGKIYQFVDGSFTADDGDQVKDWYHAFESFEEFNNWSSSDWIEIKE